jgi:hypothetical protein
MTNKKAAHKGATNTQVNFKGLPSQKQAVLSHLKEYGSITPLEALKLYGCLRLGARISDLRDEGYKITTDIAEGKRYAIYRLEKQR